MDAILFSEASVSQFRRLTILTRALMQVRSVRLRNHHAPIHRLTRDDAFAGAVVFIL